MEEKKTGKALEVKILQLLRITKLNHQRSTYIRDQMTVMRNTHELVLGKARLRRYRLESKNNIKMDRKELEW
jgi:hypothetical protein